MAMSDDYFIVGHKEDCAIIEIGPTFMRSNDNLYRFSACTCGGVVLEWKLDARGDRRWLPRLT